MEGAGLQIYEEFLGTGVAEDRPETPRMVTFTLQNRQLIFSFPGGAPADGSVALYNALGQRILALPISRGTQRTTISLRSLPPGVFFLKVGGDVKGKLVLP